MQAKGKKRKATPQHPSVSFSIPEALREGDHNTDLVFTVEGHPLYFSKAVLNVCSPEFVRQHSEGIPLEGKKYGSVAFFLIQLHPVFSAVTPMRDDMLLETLALAKEYKVDHLNKKCEQYIGSQLQLHDYNNQLTVDTILIYLSACEQNSLAEHRGKLVSLAAKQPYENLRKSMFFSKQPVPATAFQDILVARCKMLENDLMSLKQKINDLKTAANHLRSALHTLPSAQAKEIEGNLKQALEIIDSLRESS